MNSRVLGRVLVVLSALAVVVAVFVATRRTEHSHSSPDPRSNYDGSSAHSGAVSPGTRNHQPRDGQAAVASSVSVRVIDTQGAPQSECAVVIRVHSASQGRPLAMDAAAKKLTFQPGLIELTGSTDKAGTVTITDPRLNEACCLIVLASREDYPLPAMRRVRGPGRRTSSCNPNKPLPLEGDSALSSGAEVVLTLARGGTIVLYLRGPAVDYAGKVQCFVLDQAGRCERFVISSIRMPETRIKIGDLPPGEKSVAVMTIEGDLRAVESSIKAVVREGTTQDIAVALIPGQVLSGVFQHNDGTPVPEGKVTVHQRVPGLAGCGALFHWKRQPDAIFSRGGSIVSHWLHLCGSSRRSTFVTDARTDNRGWFRVGGLASPQVRLTLGRHWAMVFNDEVTVGENQLFIVSGLEGWLSVDPAQGAVTVLVYPAGRIGYHIRRSSEEVEAGPIALEPHSYLVTAWSENRELVATEWCKIIGGQTTVFRSPFFQPASLRVESKEALEVRHVWIQDNQGFVRFQIGRFSVKVPPGNYFVTRTATFDAASATAIDLRPGEERVLK